MRATALFVLSAPLLAFSQTLDSSQEAAFTAAINRIDRLSTVPLFSSFRDEINTKLERFLSTQTLQPNMKATDLPSATLQFAIAELEKQWAKTQTYLNAAARTTVIDAINNFLDTKQTGEKIEPFKPLLTGSVSASARPSLTTRISPKPSPTPTPFAGHSRGTETTIKASHKPTPITSKTDWGTPSSSASSKESEASPTMPANSAAVGIGGLSVVGFVIAVVAVVAVL